MSMKDLTKIHDISCHQSTLKGRGASPRRSGNTDNALLAIDSFGRLTGGGLASGSPRDGDIRFVFATSCDGKQNTKARLGNQW